MNLISVKNLSVYFDAKPVFCDLNFNIESCDYLCVLGENGVGKTTLMRCLTGEIKYSGSIDFIGISHGEIGWLPQNINVKKDFPTSVFEVVMSGFSGKSFWGLTYGNSKKSRAYEVMHSLNIAELKNKAFQELSGGQQQKVLLARALCAADKLLLLDEPTASLDKASQDEFYQLVKRLNDSGIASIMISHDIDKAVMNAKNILHIYNDGYFYGTTKEYLESREYGKGVER